MSNLMVYFQIHVVTSLCFMKSTSLRSYSLNVKTQSCIFHMEKSPETKFLTMLFKQRMHLLVVTDVSRGSCCLLKNARAVLPLLCQSRFYQPPYTWCCFCAKKQHKIVTPAVGLKLLSARRHNCSVTSDTLVQVV